MIRWFRRFAATSAADDPAGSGRGFGSERNPERVIFFGSSAVSVGPLKLVRAAAGTARRVPAWRAR